MVTSVATKQLYVQYGCGFNAPITWRNFDSSPTLRWERLPILGKLYTKNPTRFPDNVEYGDIVKGLPLQANSCAAIYASHVLEHLALEDFRIALRNTFHLLHSRGVFRLVVPDLQALARAYVESSESTAAEAFVRGMLLGCEKSSKGLWGRLTSALGNSAHLWMWDFKSLEYELTAIGFANIRRAEFGDSNDPMFKDVEDPERFLGSVAVEAIKP